MKKTFKRIIASLLVAVMLFGSAPIESLTGLNFDEILEVEAEAGANDLIWPVPGCSPNTHGLNCRCDTHQGNHNGQDIGAKRGTAILAPEDGVITNVYKGCVSSSRLNYGCDYSKCSGSKYYFAQFGKFFCNFGAGNGVTMKNNSTGRSFTFAHMAYTPVVENGQAVVKGQVLGYAGDSGCSFGVHLHYSVQNSNGTYINPMGLSYTQPKDTPSAHPLRFMGVSYPSNKARNDWFSISGVVSSNKKITEITMAIYNSNGVAVSPVKSVYPNVYHYDLFAMDNYARFEKANADGIYTYKIIAKDESGAEVTFSRDFTVNNKATIIKFANATETKPATPVISTSKSGDICLGDAVKISWSADRAKWYTVELKNGSNVIKRLENTTNTSLDFIADIANSAYSVNVKVYNSVGESSANKANFVIARKPSKVTFVDWDGTILETKEVKYGENAISPDTPTREGYTFIGWDKSLNKIVEDTVITATYKINKYTVKFLDYNETVLSTQIVEYGSNAIPPETTNAPIGYEFFGWDSTEYLSVKNNATIKGIYAWSNEELPIVAQITSAKRQEDGYYVYFDLTNYPTAITRGRAIVTLKTAEGKLVETTESAAFSIPAGATKKQMEVFIPCDESASNVEVIVVDSYSTGVPISEMECSTVDQGLAWSDWADTKPADGTYTDLETRDVYRYRDKEFTTASTATKEGWIQYNSTWKWSEYGSWSPYSRTVYTASDSREVDSKVFTDEAAYTEYTYGRYYHSCGHDGYATALPYCTYGHKGVFQTKTLREEIPLAKSYDGWAKYYNSTYGAWFRVWNVSGATSYGGTKNITAKTHTEYRYRDRTKIYTYYFYRWLDWSDWSIEPVTPTDNRQVDTPKKQYRFRNEFDDAGMEDTTGIQRTASTNSVGLTDNDILLPAFPELAGKEITLFIYKIDEASDWTNEFVGQTVIAADGSYSFNFKLREEPSTKTGDFTVAVGVEGTTNIVVVGTIKAPQNKYTVIFRNWDGSIIDTQIVEEGKAAAVPEVNPSREGYDFVGWSSSVANVQSDLDIEARFVKKVYTVVFVDWTTETIVTKQFEHGDILMPPDVEKTEGYNLVGWSGVTEGETIITENMIVTAEYDAETYEVNVYDFDMNIIGTHIVEHGNYAELPNELEKSKYIFIGWKDADDKDTSCVTSDLNVYPIFVFEDTVETPVANVKTGTYSENQVVKLSCVTEDSVIYYTTDGTDPLTSLTQVLYEKPIEITRSTELKFVASAFEMNDSAVVSEIYAINSDTSTSGWMLYRDIPEYVLKNPSDYSLESDIGYRYKNVVKTATTSEIERLENEGWTNEGFEYGEQSGYQLTRPEFVDLEYEVIEKKPSQVEETHYQYTHFKYYDNATETYMYAPAVIDGVDGITEEYISPSRFQITGFVAGTEIPEYSYNGEKWYNQKSVPVMVDPGYMMYAYKLKNYTLTKWTEWSTDAPLAGETRETESETVYRFINPEMCIVTLVDEFEGTNDISMLGIVGKTLSEIDIDSLVQVGYNFDGFYTDADFANKWNYESDILSGDLTLYIKQSLKKFTVNFIDADGTLLDTQIVESGSEATPPEVETEQGYVFVGWDSSAYLYITEDIDIKAIVKHESEIVKIRLSRSKFTTTVGSAFSLTATVGPETIEDKSVVWSSSDYSVADVNSEGIVMALSGGKATITATAFDGTSASCVVTVLGDPDSELNLMSSSRLVVDSSGYLRNIPIITDESMGTHIAETVAEIKKNFANESIVIVDINGKTLSDEDSVGTGSVVMLMDGETVIDSITIVVTGDYDGNGSINNRDAAKITRYLVDKEEANLYQMVAIDVNGDGYVNNRDASMISRYLVGKEVI